MTATIYCWNITISLTIPAALGELRVGHTEVIQKWQTENLGLRAVVNLQIPLVTHSYTPFR